LVLVQLLPHVSRADGQQHHRGRAKPPVRRKPPTSYKASTPCEVWIWDMTRMPGPIDGSPMKGVTMKTTMEQLGITASCSRPRVSNGNPSLKLCSEPANTARTGRPRGLPQRLMRRLG